MLIDPKEIQLLVSRKNENSEAKIVEDAGGCKQNAKKSRGGCESARKRRHAF